MLLPIEMSYFLKENVFFTNLGENQAILNFITHQRNVKIWPSG